MPEGTCTSLLSPDTSLGTEGFTPAGVADVGESGLAVGLVVPTGTGASSGLQGLFSAGEIIYRTGFHFTRVGFEVYTSSRLAFYGHGVDLI